MRIIQSIMFWFVISVFAIGTWICLYFFWVTLDKVDKAIEKIDKVEVFIDKIELLFPKADKAIANIKGK